MRFIISESESAAAATVIRSTPHLPEYLLGNRRGVRSVGWVQVWTASGTRRPTLGSFIGDILAERPGGVTRGRGFSRVTWVIDGWEWSK